MRRDPPRAEEGMALVLTLMMIVLITALVTEFVYGVFTGAAALDNWRKAQQLSLVARSGVTLAAKTVSTLDPSYLYAYIGKADIPVDNIAEGFGGRVLIRVEDENAKFNLNSLLTPGPADSGRPPPIDCFRRLLRELGLKEEIADRIADWIDKDSIPRLRDSEDGAKNYFMDSVDELLQIKGIDRQSYEKLLPYVTVYGWPAAGDVRINMNTASIPVIMSVVGDRGLAEAIARAREGRYFVTPGDLARVPGVVVDTNFMGTDRPQNFRIRVTAEDGRIRRVIEAVIATSG